MTLTVPSDWHVVSNLHCSTLHLTGLDAQGKITGTIDVNKTGSVLETHPVSGTWDATKNELVFTYSLNFGPGPIFFFPLTFTGYLFQGPGQQLFMHDPGSIPASSSNNNLLAGTFQSIFTIGTPHPNGWVARMG
jgi:hypothetical protein